MPVLATWRNGGRALIGASRFLGHFARERAKCAGESGGSQLRARQTMPKRIGGIYAAAVLAVTVASACGGSVTITDASPSASGGSNTGGTHFGGPVGQPASGGSTPVGPGGSGPISSGGSEEVCAAGLAATGCPPNYGDALASVDCVHDAVDSPRFGVCGTLRTFEFGHDGSTMCSYDLNSGMLLGGLSCGHSARCPCVSGGADPTVHCPDPGELACPVIPLGEAGAGGGAGEGGTTGAAR